jgi:hypothetical protein
MATHLPNPNQAVLNIRKIEDYCLSPSHPVAATKLGY